MNISILLLIIHYFSVNGQPQVQLPAGLIQGRTATSFKNITFYAFQDIPYAQPPIGLLRFQPPRPVEQWNGILNTTSNSRICYQVEETWDIETEDCLYLNVFTPQLPIFENPLLPVLVFIHGGGFIGGNPLYESAGPEFLMDYEIIVVTLNYRLGPFGFLSTNDDIIPGNNGLKDQQFALKWVNDNINLFGGDSKKITIHGQSAGSAAVGYHLISNKSKDLFRAAIMESGSPLTAFTYQKNAKDYAIKAASYIDPLINQTWSSQELLEFLLGVGAQDLDAAAFRINSEQSYDDIQILQGFYFAPVIEVEHPEAFLTEKMFVVLAEGRANPVPIIIGINSEEAIGEANNLDSLRNLMTIFDDNLHVLVPNDMHVINFNKTEIGKLIREIYCGNDLLQDNLACGVRYLSDAGFSRSVIKHATLQSQYSNVYFYQFSYDGLLGNVSASLDGAELVGHSEELAYLWRINGGKFNNYNMSQFPDEDLITHERLLTLWTNFVKYLNPTPSAEVLLENILWPTVAEQGESTFFYLDINKNLTIKSWPKNETFQAWNEVYSLYGTPPFDTF